MASSSGAAAISRAFSRWGLVSVKGMRAMTPHEGGAFSTLDADVALGADGAGFPGPVVGFCPSCRAVRPCLAFQFGDGRRR